MGTEVIEVICDTEPFILECAAWKDCGVAFSAFSSFLPTKPQQMPKQNGIDVFLWPWMTVYHLHGVREFGYHFSSRIWLTLIHFRDCAGGGLGIEMHQWESNVTTSVSFHLEVLEGSAGCQHSKFSGLGGEQVLLLPPLFCAVPLIHPAQFWVLASPVNSSCFSECCLLSCDSLESRIPSYDLLSGGSLPHLMQIAVQFICS